MSTRIPLPIERGQAFLNGMTSGGNLFQQIMRPIIAREQLKQKTEHDAASLAQLENHFQAKFGLDKAAAGRAAQAAMDNHRLAQQKLDPNYEWNQFNKIFGGGQSPQTNQTNTQEQTQQYPDLHKMFSGQGVFPEGEMEQGNINLANRPQVQNPETGGTSTVYSMSIGTPKGEVLIPRVSDQGQILSEKDAIDQFHKSGKHLGVYSSPEEATKAAEMIHQQQAQSVGAKPGQNLLDVLRADPIKHAYFRHKYKFDPLAQSPEDKEKAAFDLFKKKREYISEHPSSNTGALHGTAAEVDSHFKYMQQHPANTPEGQEEMKQWDLKNSSRNILNENRAENTKNASTKLLTTDAKRAKELDAIDKNLNPYNGEPLTPQRKAELKESYSAKEGHLPAGQNYIFDPKTNERIGIEHETTEGEKKEIKGRETFNQLQPIITKGLSEYSGHGSYQRFLSDTYNYETDKNAKKRIDAFLLAKALITADIVKEDATLGGANTNQVYNRLRASLDSSDLKPIIVNIGTGINLPKTAQLKSGLELPVLIDRITKNANKRVPAKVSAYFEPEKHEMVNVHDNETGKTTKMTRAEYNKLRGE